jgi:DNA-binding PadR family transcriptional regulator
LPKAELLPGTLDLLILKAVSLGALYPALYRLEHQGLLNTALRAQEA